MKAMFRMAAILLLLLTSLPLRAAQAGHLELMFVDRSGCPWCARFEREVLPVYPKTDVGQQVPLRRVSLDDGQPKAATLDEPVRFTPTFVLLKDGRELGRIVGYMNDATFWGLLEKMLAERRDR
jgi:thioredoxin-related protein